MSLFNAQLSEEEKALAWGRAAEAECAVVARVELCDLGVALPAEQTGMAPHSPPTRANSGANLFAPLTELFAAIHMR